MCELSGEMITSEEMSLNYRHFPDRLKNLFGSVVSDETDLDHWHYDMMGNTLLIRNDDGDYTPAHRSLLEFFTAFKVIAQLGLLPSDFTSLARSQSNIDKHSRATDYMWSSYFRRKVDEKGEICLIPPLGRFCPEDKDMTLASLGRMGEAVLRFVHEMTNVEEVRLDFHKLLSEIIVEFKAGNRDPQKEQDIIRFVLSFRALSQEWEAQADEGRFIRDFWNHRLEQEREVAGKKAKPETMHLIISGGESIEIEMVQIPAGAVLMGDEDAGPIHRVEITKPFMIATASVMQTLYRALTGERPSEFKGDDLPVENVSWFDAVRFCNDLSKRLNLEPAYRIDGEQVAWIQENDGFRLPTEAEWEYACRAGTSTRFACGDLEADLETMGWYGQNSGNKTHPVKSKTPNAWGIFDMHGNIWEWVWDWAGEYSGGLAVDPKGPERGANRVVRGSSWYDDAHYCRAALRFNDPPDSRDRYLGFRLARSVALGP